MKNQQYPLYDIPSASTLKELIGFVADRYESDEAFRIPQKGKTDDEYKTYRDFYNDIENFGTYLLSNGLKGEKIAILGENCYSWIVSYFAVTNSGNVALPLDKELSKEELMEFVNSCDCRGIIFTSSYKDYINYFKENGKNIQLYINMNDLKTPIEQGFSLVSGGFREFSEVDVSPDSLAAIVFTSGTTGKSKGVMLSHFNIASDAASVCGNACASGRGILILPLHHTFSITANVLCELIYGMRIYAITSLRTIQSDMQKDKTTTAIVVPAVVETMHKKVLAAAEKDGKLKKMKTGMKTSNMLMKIGVDIRRKLFSDVFDAFGGELNTIICGGAALSRKVEEDFCSWGFNMICGYGITECAPVACVNRNEHQKRGSIGLPLNCNKVKIGNPGIDGIGEIYVKGSNVFQGYYKNMNENGKVFTRDFWFKTGDLGYIDKDGFVFITGRIKNLIILSNGKNVSPEEIEGKLIDEISLISEVVIYEENDALTAEIYSENGEEESIREAMNTFNRHMPAYKKIANIKIRTEEFPKTTTLKIKRRATN